MGQRIIPMLAYEDAAAAIDWLTSAFGFTERESQRYTDENGVVGHAELELDGEVVMLATPNREYESPRRHRETCDAARRWLDNPWVIDGVFVQVDDVEAHHARAAGAGDLRIIVRHVIPNAIYPFLVLSSLDMGIIVITAAALSFLGLGPDVGFADWGTLINLSRNWIVGKPDNPFAYWYVLAFPGVAIFLFVLGWNLLGDAFRDILDPRLRGSS